MFNIQFNLLILRQLLATLILKSDFLSSAGILSTLLLKCSFRNNIRVSNSMGSTCLQRSTADDKICIQAKSSVPFWLCEM